MDYNIKLDREKLKRELTTLEYNVCLNQGTEPPFNNDFWDNKAEGTYSCECCKTALFSSKTKFDSGTGWPSFFQPLKKESIEEITDNSHSMTRIEVRCKECGSHLGHVFQDGPAPTHLRYCINSASLDFSKK